MHFNPLTSFTRLLLLVVVVSGIAFLSPNVALAADSDGDGIDDSLDNCPSVVNPDQRNTDAALAAAGSSFAGDLSGDACDTDDDNDGLIDTREHFMGTDALNNCSADSTLNNEHVDSWPQDNNDDRRVTLADVLRYSPIFGGLTPAANFDPRLDLNQSGQLTLADVLMMSPVFNQTCVPPVGPIGPAPANGVPSYTFPLEPARNPSGSGPDSPHGGMIDDPGITTASKNRLFVGNLPFAYPPTGETNLYGSDLVIPGRGIDFIMARKYRSGMDFDGPLGNNWDFNHNRRLVVEPDLDVVRLDGLTRADTYDENAGVYTAPNGFYTRLVKNGDGSYTERDFAGNVVQYAIPVGNLARMTSMSDRNGNTMQYQYDGLNRLIRVVDTLGRNIDFSYNLQGRLAAVQDYSGRVVRYHYDGNYDLVRVFGPGVSATPNANNQLSGRPTAYTYSSGFTTAARNHDLLSVTPAQEVVTNGPARDQYTYDSLDRVISHQVGGTNASGVAAGGTITYDYAPTAGCPAPEQTCVTDANGNITEYRFDAAGRAIRIEELTNRNIRPADPASYITSYSYNTDGEVLSVTKPEGNTLQYTYDSGNPNRLAQGNQLSSTTVADLARGGDQASVTTAFTYEPIYNRVRTIVEPRGTDGSYVPQNGGAQSAARYRTTYALDYEEGCDFTAIGAKIGRTALDTQNLLTAAGMCGGGLGDVNLDGITTQVSGNTIRTQSPTNNLLAGSNQSLAEGTTGQIEIELVAMNLVGQPVTVIDPELNVHTFEYFSEQDPDGDGTINFPAGNPTTGGYLRRRNIDTASNPARDTGTNPTPVSARTEYKYDARGNRVRAVDGRGVATDYAVNALGETVRMTRAAAVNVFVPSPAEPAPLVAEALLTQYFYDYNGRLIVQQVEDRGNTSLVDGNLATADLPPGYTNPDPAGGVPYQDTAYRYDSLDRRVQQVSESGTLTGTAANPIVKYRYDKNGNLVLTMNPTANLPTIDPAHQVSNVSAAVFDERDLPFTTTAGGQTAQGRSLAAHAAIAALPGIPDSPDIATNGFTYDDNGNVETATDAQDTDGVGGAEVTTYLYDGLDRRVSEVDAAGGQSFYQYGPAGNRVSSRAFGPVGGATPTNNSAATFAQPLTPLSFTQALLARTDYKYDESSRMFETNDHLFVSAGVATVRPPVLIDGPLGSTNDGLVVERFEYDRLNRTRFHVEDDYSSTAPAFAMRWTYDGAGRAMLIGHDTSDQIQQAATHDDQGFDRSIIQYEQSSAGVVPPLSESFTTSYLYDSLGRLTRTCEPTIGQTMRYAYDSLDRLVSSSDALNGTLNPDPAGQCGNINDPGNTQSYAYDGLSRRIASVTDLRVGGTGAGLIDTGNPANPDGRIVSESFFDPNSRPFAVADDGSTGGDNNTNIGQLGSLGNITTTAYDHLNRPITRTYDDGTTEQYQYDRDSNVNRMTDQNGSLHVYVYDALNRLVSDTITRAPGVVGTTLVTYQYDALGRLRNATDNNDPVNPGDDSSLGLAYDSLGRRLEEVHNGAATSSRYSGDGNGVALIYPNNRQINYAYDALDRPTSTQDNAEPFPTSTQVYLGARLLDQANFNPATGANRGRLTYRDPILGTDVGYDALGRVVRMQHLDPANNPIAVFDYQYDRMNNRTQETRVHSGVGDISAYDSAYRMTTFSRGGIAGPVVTNYLLDGPGNWVGPGQGVPDNRNRYTQFAGQPHTFDNNGNLLNDATRIHSYDAFNRLVHVDRNTPFQPISGHKYDALGREVTKIVQNSAPFNATHVYGYAGGSLIQENKSTTGLDQYLWARHSEDTPTLDARLDRQATPGQPLFLHADGDGDVALITNQFAQPVERTTYDPYGVPRIEDQFSVPIPGAQASQQGNSLLMDGMRWDPEVQLFESAYKPAEGRIVCRCDFVLMDPGVTLSIGGVDNDDSEVVFQTREHVLLGRQVGVPSLHSSGDDGVILLDGSVPSGPAGAKEKFKRSKPHLSPNTGHASAAGTGEGAYEVIYNANVHASKNRLFVGGLSFAGGEVWNHPMFTAGIVTDVGELAVPISAGELNFQTEGPIICQALFQRLQPNAPVFGGGGCELIGHGGGIFGPNIAGPFPVIPLMWIDPPITVGPGFGEPSVIFPPIPIFPPPDPFWPLPLVTLPILPPLGSGLQLPIPPDPRLSRLDLALQVEIFPRAEPFGPQPPQVGPPPRITFGYALDLPIR